MKQESDKETTVPRASTSKHIGSSFESFLEENGIKDEVYVRADVEIKKRKLSHVAWPKIVAFHTVRKFAHDAGVGKITYRSKVKLHGTNAAIRLSSSGAVAAMSRKNVITPLDDNCGFAAWVHKQAEWVTSMCPGKGEKDIVIWGEWVGPGVQNTNIALVSLPNKVFAIFSVALLNDAGQIEMLFSDPQRMLAIVPQLANAPRDSVRIIPWYGSPIEVDFGLYADEIIDRVVNPINASVAAVEERCPWSFEEFGVSGVGEGLVYFPVLPFEGAGEHAQAFMDYGFKAKGKEHCGVNGQAPAQIAPQKAGNLAGFAEMVLTDARLDQGAKAVNDESIGFSTSTISQFLRWIGDDVASECIGEMETSDVDPKEARKSCVSRARTWYLEQLAKQNLGG